MVITYFEIDKMIVEEEQDGKERADYGKKVIKELSKALTKEFGKWFLERNIEQMRQFYFAYSKPQTLSAESKNKKQQTLSAVFKKQQTLSDKPETSSRKSKNIILSWSYYLKLMRIEDINGRSFYEIESFKNNWSVR
jgi:hypothetical protein